jgi:4-aminobutyrate aminotransferase-like enzyme
MAIRWPALAVRPDVLAAFGRECRYFNTFGGNPVSMAAGMAVLDVIEQAGLMDNAQRVGQYLRAGLERLQSRHPTDRAKCAAPGCLSAWNCAPTVRPRTPATMEATRVVNQMRERQVLLSATGEYANTLKIRPPLVFSEANADLLLQTLDDVLTAL